MDAIVPQDVRNVAYGQAVWSWHLDAGVKLVEMIDQRRGLTSPDTPGRARSKP